MNDFGLLNWSILIGYIIANLILGFVISKKISSANDFYIGRKTTPWWAIGISVVATYVSALTFLGAPAWSYKEGLSVIAIHLNYPLVIVAVVCLFFRFFTTLEWPLFTNTKSADLVKKPAYLSLPFG